MIPPALHKPVIILGFPGGSDGEESTRSAGDPVSIPGLGRSPGEGNGNPLQYSCLENPMDRGVWQATVHGVTESDTTEWLSLSLQIFYCKHRPVFRLLWRRGLRWRGWFLSLGKQQLWKNSHEKQSWIKIFWQGLYWQSSCWDFTFQWRGFMFDSWLV